MEYSVCLKQLLISKFKIMNRRTHKNFFLRNDVCCYCSRPFKEGLEGTKEHVVPKSNGGTDSINNLKPCCFECNQLKSNLDLK